MLLMATISVTFYHRSLLTSSSSIAAVHLPVVSICVTNASNRWVCTKEMHTVDIIFKSNAGCIWIHPKELYCSNFKRKLKKKKKLPNGESGDNQRGAPKRQIWFHDVIHEETKFSQHLHLSESKNACCQKCTLKPRVKCFLNYFTESSQQSH